MEELRDKFQVMVEQNLRYYLNDLWPETVRDRLAEVEAQQERNIVRGYN